MGLFDKSITDQTWINQVTPYYCSLVAIATELNTISSKGLDNAQFDEEYSIQDALQKLPELHKRLKDLPPPRSSDARLAKRNIEKAIKYYIEAAVQANHYLKDRYNGVIAGNLSFQRGFFNSFVKDANRPFEEAYGYLSPRIK